MMNKHQVTYSSIQFIKDAARILPAAQPVLYKNGELSHCALCLKDCGPRAIHACIEANGECEIYSICSECEDLVSPETNFNFKVGSSIFVTDDEATRIRLIKSLLCHAVTNLAKKYGYPVISQPLEFAVLDNVLSKYGCHIYMEDGTVIHGLFNWHDDDPFFACGENARDALRIAEGLSAGRIQAILQSGNLLFLEETKNG